MPTDAVGTMAQLWRALAKPALLNLYFVVALAFDTASLFSARGGGPAYTSTDPIIGSVLLLVLWLALKVTQVMADTVLTLDVVNLTVKVHGGLCLLGAAVLRRCSEAPPQP